MHLRSVTYLHIYVHSYMKLVGYTVIGSEQRSMMIFASVLSMATKECKLVFFLTYSINVLDTRGGN
jgi:sensor histidine kinase YesM